MRPEQHVGAAAVATFDRQRSSDVDHDLDFGLQAHELRRKIVVRKPRLPHGERHGRDRVVELAERHGLGLAAVAQADGFARVISSASATPSRRSFASSGRDFHSRQAFASAIRCPARLPLSTVETYLRVERP